MEMAAERESTAGLERRRFERSDLLYSGALYDSGRMVDCVIKDISPGGAKLMIERPLAEPGRLILDIDGVGLFPSRTVWQNGEHAGIEFLDDPATVKTWIEAAWRRPSGG